MPTQRVGPRAEEQLGEVAHALLKARKVVVVTGAGISTNSGIPDFRSENGLYSLIQAQFDAVSRQARPNEQSDHDQGLDTPEAAPVSRPTKRRKLSVDGLKEDDDGLVAVKNETGEVRGVAEVEPILPLLLGLSHEAPTDTTTTSTATASPATAARRVVEKRLGTPQAKVLPMAEAERATSPLSSPPPGEPSTPAEFHLGTPTPKNATTGASAASSLPPSSSPLSSPPPALFDPFLPGSPSDGRSSRSSSISSSDADGDDEEPSASQCSSSGGKSTLPNMKGKDLFDANIWSDPVRTSVFYTFATSLRQKIKTAEPTTSHRFIGHLRDRGKLVRCYTQNIDQIEEKVGLSTRLQDGPGRRGRFSRRSTANTSQLSQMVDEPCLGPSEEQSSVSDMAEQQPDSSTDASQQSQSQDAATTDAVDGSRLLGRGPEQQLPQSGGVECVFLHGSLDHLRCFLCSRACSWDEHLEMETLSGQQPECPHCVGATAARLERGKRALGVGKLRPDIVLYGEEHPSSHLISPIVTHDLGLYPDMLLILGTSLRVHGLKVMVREFAKAVHSKGGKVVFVNFTKPPESTWGDIIDYWVQWDCDAWVDDLQVRIPMLWQETEVVGRPKKKKKKQQQQQQQRESHGTSGESDGEEKRMREREREEQKKTKEREREDQKKKRKEREREDQKKKIKEGEREDQKKKIKEREKEDQKKKTKEREREDQKKKEEKEREGQEKMKKDKTKGGKTTERNPKAPAAKPMAVRDTRVTGAYWTGRIVDELHRITGHPAASASPAVPLGQNGSETGRARKPKQLRGKSALGSPGEARGRQASMLNPHHGRCRQEAEDGGLFSDTVTAATSSGGDDPMLGSGPGEEHGRAGKRRTADGEADGERCASRASRANRASKAGAKAQAAKDELKLPPIQHPLPTTTTTTTTPTTHPPLMYGKPRAMEPRSPPPGPLSSLSPNVRGGGGGAPPGRPDAFHHCDALVRLLREVPSWGRARHSRENGWAFGRKTGREASPTPSGSGPGLALGGRRSSMGFGTGLGSACEGVRGKGELEGQLMSWGSSWSCRDK